jgi:ferredoxin
MRDCFYAGENMLVIHPDKCIDCGVCEPECPAQAIRPDTEEGLEDSLKLNREYAAKWPNLTAKESPPADAKNGTASRISSRTSAQIHMRSNRNGRFYCRRLREDQQRKAFRWFVDDGLDADGRRSDSLEFSGGQP